MSAENDVLFPHSETPFFGDQFAHTAHYGNHDHESFWKESALDGLLRADLLQHESGSGSLCELLLSNSNYDTISRDCEDQQAGNLPSYQQKFELEPLFALSEIGDSCRPPVCQSYFNMPQINVTSGTSTFDSSVCRNDTESLASLIGKAKTSSPEAILAAERLNYLSLQQIVQALDMKEEGNGSIPDNETDLQATAITDAATEMLLLSSASLSSPLVCTSNSGRTPAHSSYASNEPPESVVRAFVGTNCTIASGASSLVPVPDDLPPASSLTRSAEAMIEIEPAFLGNEIQQRTLFFNHPKTVAYSVGLPNENDMLDPTEDGLSPLPISVKSSLRPHPIQRSFSSHTLGQMMAMASPREASLFTSEPLDCSEKFIESTQTSTQPHPSELQGFNSRPMMPSMRRVYSTGDIQTFGRGSTFLPECSSQEEGCFKIGRYTSEERKVRISRYRQKRAERNFNKKIKYVCRKTLADNRPRVRGRFAKNDDPTEHEPKRREYKPDDEDDGEGDLLLEEEDFEEYTSSDPCYMLRTNSSKGY
ncbi:hypothetical protein O6H91_05G023800 [Diphasiastrum complanatum]|uniref:Uncharacterized protein n=1 Tax=Diphasiastrum complanatum TaxID=34168 RepID=A0ACC2DLK6_DIPCM|nr:hypothetical protein O6H91_05G023800 [Diphasiastrum complanatum]